MGGAWAQDLPEQLTAIKPYTFGQSREPLSVVADMVKAALASAEESQKLAAQLAALLGTDATLDCKQFVCRQLAIIGGPGNVPAIVPLLANAETVDMARYALQPIPGAEVDQALIAALAASADKARVGIINTLGDRRSESAVDAIAPAMTGDDAMAAEAALAALGRIGGAEAVKQLVAAKAAVADDLKMAWCDAYLLCADRFLKEGNTGEAAAIYEEMFAPEQAQRVRVAAFQGLVDARGPKGIDLVIEVLGGGDAVLQGVATGVVRRMPGTEKTKEFAKQLPKMSPEGQVRLISALADRGDKVALPAVEKAAKSEDAEVRAAAMAAMARVGDASSVVFLANAAVEAGGRDREAIRRSLYNLTGEDVDQQIIAKLGSGKPEVRAELIRSTAERNMTEAVDELLKAAGDRDEGVRVAAFKALGVLAGPEYLDALVKELVGAEGDATRKEAEEAVVAVGRNIADENARAGAVLAALGETHDVTARCSLLRVVAGLGDSNGLEALRAAAKDADAVVKDAGIRGLAQWPTIEALDDLDALAKTADDEAHKVLALRGYVRLLALPSDRSGAESVVKYADVLGMATRAEEKKAVLAGLASVKEPGVLGLVAPYYEDEALQAEAVAAGLVVAKAVCGACPDEAKSAAAKIMELTADEEAKKQAQAILDLVGRFGGFITAWEVSGPYAQEGKEAGQLFDTAFPPEDPNAKVAWTIMPVDLNPDTPWLIGLDKAMGGNNVVAYLRTAIVSPAAQDALLELGSDDGVKVWLNGQVVHGANASRGCSPATDKVNVKLEQGDNALMLKVTQGGADWAACARICAPDGKDLAGVKSVVR